jgi:cytochrome c-type biogenesis protein CcmE
MPIVCTEIVTSIFREVKIILKEKVEKNPDDKNAKEVLGKLDSLYVNLTLETAKHTLNVQKENISVLKESESK